MVACSITSATCGLPKFFHTGSILQCIVEVGDYLVLQKFSRDGVVHLRVLQIGQRQFSYVGAFLSLVWIVTLTTDQNFVEALMSLGQDESSHVSGFAGLDDDLPLDRIEPHQGRVK